MKPQTLLMNESEFLDSYTLSHQLKHTPLVVGRSGRLPRGEAVENNSDAGTR